jgi:2-keto-3-deoxy-L-arabinonate dehydratase
MQADGPGSLFGIWSGLFSFFDANRRLDRTAMRRQVQALADAGCRGVVALGAVGDPANLTPEERLEVVAWAREDLNGGLPLAAEVTPGSVEQQVTFSRAVIEAGADLLILPSPSTPQPADHQGAADSARMMSFFDELLEQLCTDPVCAETTLALRLRSDTLHLGLSPGAVEELTDRWESVQSVICEAPAVAIERAVARLGRRVAVFSDRGGLELIEVMQAGCAGAIVTPEVADLLRRAHRLMGDGRPGAAQLAYEHALPTLIFTGGSADIHRCYGRRIAARRLGLGPVQDRAPALAPTPFGSKTAREHADRLGLYARDIE